MDPNATGIGLDPDKTKTDAFSETSLAHFLDGKAKHTIFVAGLCQDERGSCFIISAVSPQNSFGKRKSLPSEREVSQLQFQSSEETKYLQFLTLLTSLHLSFTNSLEPSWLYESGRMRRAKDDCAAPGALWQHTGASFDDALSHTYRVAMARMGRAKAAVNGASGRCC